MTFWRGAKIWYRSSVFGAKVAMTLEVVRCQVAVNHAGVTKQRNSKKNKNKKQTNKELPKGFSWMLLCDYLKGFLILTTLSSEFWHELQWHLEIRFVSWRKWKNLLNSERVKRIPNKNCQKVFQKPRMRWISVKLPLGERTRPCMLACFESPTLTKMLWNKFREDILPSVT